MTFKELIQNGALLRHRGKIRRMKMQISFMERLAAAADVIVCLPEEKKNFDAVIGEMDKLKKIFPRAKITLLHHRQNFLPTNLTKRYESVEWSRNDSDRYSIPTFKFISKLFISPCDLMIDLNPDFHFFFLYLTLKSEAPIRVCFAHPRRDDWYNMIYRPESTGDLAKMTRALLQYLSIGKMPAAD